jgi:hypothetical protein
VFRTAPVARDAAVYIITAQASIGARRERMELVNLILYIAITGQWPMTWHDHFRIEVKQSPQASPDILYRASPSHRCDTDE